MKVELFRKRFKRTVSNSMVPIAFVVWALVLLGSRFPLYTQVVESFLYKFAKVTTTFFIQTEILWTLTLIFLGLTIPIFVLTVTMIGRAAKVSVEKQREQNQEAKKNRDNEIEELQKRIDTDPDNTHELVVKISVIKKMDDERDRALSETERKYCSLELAHAVFKPSVFFVISLFMQGIMVSVNAVSVQSLLLVLSLSTFSYAIYRLYFTLSVAQEVISSSDEESEEDLRSFITERLTGGLVDALRTFENEKTPTPEIFFDEGLPLTLEASKRQKINFHVKLNETGGSEAENVVIFIVFPSEFDITPTGRQKVHKQSSDFRIPNATSVIIDSQSMFKNTNYQFSFDIQSPSPGEYGFLYRVQCKGYSEDLQEGVVIVEELLASEADSVHE